MSLELPNGGGISNETGYSSMASCSTGSSTSSANSHSSSGSSRLSAKAVKEGWKKFKSQIFNRNGGGNRMNNTTSYHDFAPVSTAPGGGPAGAAGCAPPAPGGVIPRIRASKSMQNLEAITRDSYYNLRDATSNLKEKYHSRMELRQAKPRAEYVEFWDEDDLDGETRASLRMVGLE